MSKPITWSQLPMGLPNGDMLPHVSAKMRTNLMDQVFFNIGGPEAMAAWAGKPENRGEFYKMWARGAVRNNTTEHTLGEGVESMLKELDRRSAEKTINDAPYTVIDQEPEET